jgi:hypothetical protein
MAPMATKISGGNASAAMPAFADHHHLLPGDGHEGRLAPVMAANWTAR